MQQQHTHDPIIPASAITAIIHIAIPSLTQTSSLRSSPVNRTYPSLQVHLPTISDRKGQLA